MMLEAIKFYRDAISIVTLHFNDRTSPSSYLHRCATPMTSCIYYEVTPIHPAPLTHIVTSLVGILWSPDGGITTNLGYVIFCSVLLRKLKILSFFLNTAKRKRYDEIDKINTRAIFKVYLLSSGALWTNFTYGYNASLSVSCDGIKCCFVAQKIPAFTCYYTRFFYKTCLPWLQK